MGGVGIPLANRAVSAPDSALRKPSAAKQRTESGISPGAARPAACASQS